MCPQRSQKKNHIQGLNRPSHPKVGQREAMQLIFFPLNNKCDETPNTNSFLNLINATKGGNHSHTRTEHKVGPQLSSCNEGGEEGRVKHSPRCWNHFLKTSVNKYLRGTVDCSGPHWKCAGRVVAWHRTNKHAFWCRSKTKQQPHIGIVCWWLFCMEWRDIWVREAAPWSLTGKREHRIVERGPQKNIPTHLQTPREKKKTSPRVGPKLTTWRN